MECVSKSPVKRVNGKHVSVVSQCLSRSNPPAEERFPGLCPVVLGVWALRAAGFRQQRNAVFVIIINTQVFQRHHFFPVSSQLRLLVMKY